MTSLKAFFAKFTGSTHAIAAVLFVLFVAYEASPPLREFVDALVARHNKIAVLLGTAFSLYLCYSKRLAEAKAG